MAMKSPCIRMCTLNENDVCLGCGRLLNEITSWTSYSDQKRQALLLLCNERKRSLGCHSIEVGKNSK